MRLTRILNVVFPKNRKYNGLKYEGKNQKPKLVKVSYKYEAVNDVARETQNMTYLNRPYIIHGEHHLASLPNDRQMKNKAYLENRYATKRFLPDRTLNEHLEPLLINKKWE